MKINTKHSTRFDITFLFSLSLIIVVFFTGCNIMRITSDYDKGVDFKSYKTYTISQSIKTLRMSEDNKSLLEDAIGREMKARGYQRSDAITTDLWIDLFIKYDKSTDASQSIGAGAPIGFYSYAYSFGLTRVTTDYHDCIDGTLFLNIIDGKKKQIVWFGKISTGIDEDQTELERQDLIDKVIKKLFKKYPVPVQTEK